jgi:hypothetical protein
MWKMVYKTLNMKEQRTIICETWERDEVSIINILPYCLRKFPGSGEGWSTLD